MIRATGPPLTLAVRCAMWKTRWLFVAKVYLLRLLRRQYNVVFFPDFAGIDATTSGPANPKEWGTVFVGREHFTSLDAAAVSGVAW